MNATTDNMQETTRLVADIDRASSTGDFARAGELADAAIRKGHKHPALFSARAVWFEKQGLYREAVADFRHMSALLPQHPGPHMKAGLCHIKLERWRDAVNAFDAAIAFAPNIALAHERKGVALAFLGRFEASRQSYRRAVELKPDFADAYAGLALLAARERDAQKVNFLVGRAFAAAPGHVAARVALAVLDFASENIASAEESLRAVLADPQFGNDPRVVNAVGSLADGLDKRGRLDVAFAVYSALNANRLAAHVAHIASVRSSLKVTLLTEHFSQSSPWPRSYRPVLRHHGEAGHVFVVGFMRSGTSLLEAVLASNTDTVALDEHDCLSAAAAALLSDAKGLARLSDLGETELDHWRGIYWQAVRDQGIETRGKVFIDKLAFNSLKLPLIAKLFPGAKIVLALRDPRDVVLSCFRHRFDVGPDSIEFLDLENCARYYAAVMKLVSLCRQKLPLCLHQHRYEDMIENFDGSVRAICDFVGIPWRESMRDFSSGARVINERAISASQVRKGLYSSGVAQWRRYSAQLEPIQPILAPWIAQYGYPVA